MSVTAHEFVSIPNEHDIVTWCYVQYTTIKALKIRNNIYMIKPDKRAGVVILNRVDYVNKMNIILGDISKFPLIGPSSTHHLTDKLELKFQKRLLEVYKGNPTYKDTYNRIRPVGSC